MNMKNLKKQKIILILVLFVGISASFAFYQTRHTLENEFITLEYGQKVDEDFTSPNDWKPGDTTSKTVIVKNTGDVCENVRVSYTEEWKSKNDTVLPNIDSETNERVSILNLDNQNDWIQKGEYYYYNKNVLPGENTTSFLESVTFNPNYSGNITCEKNNNKVTCTGGEDSHIGGKYTLSLKIEGIQCEGMEEEWGTTIEELQNKYNITYHLNGGSLKTNALSGYPENNEEIILPIPTRRGYEFSGWYESNDFSTEEIKMIPKNSIGDKEYYASYQPIKYKIIYHLNNGVQAANPVTTYTIETETFHLPEPTREEYTFAGWKEKNGTEEDLYLQIEKGTTGNKEYSARWFTTITNFDYTGGEQKFKVLRTGTYKIDTWGAQGGSILSNITSENEYHGGYGGYSYGNISLTKGNILYINVGGSGQNPILGFGENIQGGYNGGGTVIGNSSVDHEVGSGGGATHIALVSGELNKLSSQISSIVIVSGGGGGAWWQPGYIYYNDYKPLYLRKEGGAGGGINGMSQSQIDYDSWIYSTDGVGTQNSGYAFGVGASHLGACGGGGGYYGGYTALYIPNEVRVCGGGSGYIGNSNLTNKHMVCYNCTASNEEHTKTISNTCVNANPVADCSKIGNGYARITWVG